METKRLNFKFSQRQHEMLQELANDSGMTMTSYLQHLIINNYKAYQNKQALQPTIDKMSELFRQAKEINPQILQELANSDKT